MGVLGIGVDILRVPRIAALVQRKSALRLASRILSQPELSVWNNMVNKDADTRLRFLAVRYVIWSDARRRASLTRGPTLSHRWSVKEAAYKALYPHARPTWKELTFLDGPSHINGKKPVLRYLPEHSATPSVLLHASISHDGDYVFATVLAETSLND